MVRYARVLVFCYFCCLKKNHFIQWKKAIQDNVNKYNSEKCSKEHLICLKTNLTYKNIKTDHESLLCEVICVILLFQNILTGNLKTIDITTYSM